METTQSKNKIITIAVLTGLILAIGGGAAYAVARNQTPTQNNEAMMQKDDKMMEKTPETAANDVMKKDEVMKEDEKMMKTGLYTDYDQAMLLNAKTGKVVLFFKASWCPSCQSVDKDINSNVNKIPENVSILKVDYDTATELKKKYGVTYQHTFVQVNENGDQIKKWSASPALGDILKQI